MSKHCPKCKVTHIGTYCPQCGTKLIGLPRCRKCNEELYPRDNFCPTCGAKVERR